MILVFFYKDILWEELKSFFAFITDRDKVKNFIISFGDIAPIIFIMIQVLQVIFAPLPGEATGFVGGYLFGAAQGFLYSSIGLAAGSCINFLIGRLLGIHYIRRLVPPEKLEKLNALTTNNGLFLIFLLFVFPGFPKDYFCIFLGISEIPFKFFIIMASIGRMPGTLLLSLQGASLFEKNYLIFSLVSVLCLISILLAFLYREKMYQWIKKDK
jgi:uncharacterized membrane protein YdjX (TVP38/TMEM64 family)